ncbi:serine carboxypeptidase-like 17 [Cajanus cajan]|uniref:serine carboxypeptidase-like 17 n=1 Tax=Cajanus cajan TaxID=3821 RepID=UPI0010FAFD08|nr:serine carboxypeptidase-like 17 [Cajanus cajan]
MNFPSFSSYHFEVGGSASSNPATNTIHIEHDEEQVEPQHHALVVETQQGTDNLRGVALVGIDIIKVEFGNIVKTLPGFQGPLPFKLETGYVSVEESELFYYFVESTGKPRIDPLLLYLVGGPGCSGLNALFYQVGPLAFNGTEYSGGIPQIILKSHAWTKTASIIFPDVPVGTGFSYATTPQGYLMSDTISARQTYKFLRKWLIEHPEYISNRIYIATDSYSGIFAPIISQYILDGNAAEHQPFINLIGFLSGSPHINTSLEGNSKVPYAHNMALISDKLYEAAKENCNGWYYEVDPSNAKCVEALLPISQCVGDIYEDNVLESNCALISPKPDDESAQRALKEARRFPHPSPKHKFKDWWCKNFVYILSDIWANNKTVQEALYVREGGQRWYRCNLVVKYAYNYDIRNVIPYQKNLTNSGLQILVYGGDLDMVIPHISTEKWLRNLNLTIDTSWTPWFVDGQVAGYKVIYSNTGYRLTYATLKGAGHSPTEYFHERCFEMFQRWIHFYPL